MISGRSTPTVPDVLDAEDALATGMARRAAVFLFGLSAFVLATVYAAEHLGGLVPCSLCLEQRWPWWLTLCLGGIGLVQFRYPFSPAVRATLAALAAVTLLVSAGMAVNHVGVEEGRWPGPAFCTPVDAVSHTLEELRRLLLSTPPVRCDVPAWTLFGISMAGYNALVSGSMGLILIAVAGKLAPRRRRPKPE